MDETIVMNQEQKSVSVRTTGAELFTVIEGLKALSTHKKAIGCITVAAAALSTAIAFVIPPSYVATTTMLPPQQAQSGAAALLSQLGGAAGMVANATGLKSPSELYMGILKSRTIGDDLVKKMGLLSVYDTPSPEKAREELKAHTVISSGKEGLITIAVEDNDRTRAAQMANAYVESLIKLTRDLALTEASQRRLFFEKQLETTKNNLAAAEFAMKRGLDAKGVISVDADSRTMVETTAKLRARISAKEVELHAMQSFVTENNNEFKRGQVELASLRRELAALENGRAADDGIAVDGDKKSGLENIKLLRDVKYQQMLYEMLAKQFEVARLDEARDNAVIQVLDPAVAPEKKSKPRRSVIILMSTATAFAAALALSCLLERRKKALGLHTAAGNWKRIFGG